MSTRYVVPPRYAVFEIEPRHTGAPHSVVLGTYLTAEEAQEDRVKYGYGDDNYYVAILEKSHDQLHR